MAILLGLQGLRCGESRGEMWGEGGWNHTGKCLWGGEEAQASCLRFHLRCFCGHYTLRKPSAKVATCTKALGWGFGEHEEGATCWPPSPSQPPMEASASSLAPDFWWVGGAGLVG